MILRSSQSECEDSERSEWRSRPYNSLYNLSKQPAGGQAASGRPGRQRRPLPPTAARLSLATALVLLTTASFQPILAQDYLSQANTVFAHEDARASSHYDLRSLQAASGKGEVTKISIDGIEPEAGPTSGETRVLVRGGPFAQLQSKYPKPMCKFGHDDMIVEATYVLCTSAPQNLESKEARHRDKNDTCLQCDNSPPSAKAEIVPFTISLTGDFSDVSNSVPFRFFPPTRIYGIYPRYGPKDGETVVQVWGENFLNFDEQTRCAFGSKSVPATFISSTYMICVAPFSDVVEKPIPFTVSLNNQQNSKDTLFFWYYSFPAITDLIPDRGPDTGGSKLLLRGRNFHPFNEIADIDNRNDTFCMFENLGKVPATIINSTKAVCVAPPSYVLRQAVVEITLNNQQYTDDNNVFYYYRPPYLFDTNPREGPVSGGTRVIAVGSNFRDTKNVTCKFNETVVPGKYLSSSEIECFAPYNEKPGFVPLSIAMELDMYSPAVQFLYYEKPVIESIEPLCGPESGYTQLTVKGKNFIDMGKDQVLCVFNSTLFTNATIMDTETIMCDSPSVLNSQGYSKYFDRLIWYNVQITVDGGRELVGPSFKFTYYKDPQVLSIEPNSGPLSGFTKVKIGGSGFNQAGACNKVARFSVFETSLVLNEGNDTTVYVHSPPASVPDDVVVAVALNGQQFSKDIVIHQKDLENTFEYYSDPIVTTFDPKSGPSIGGTQMTISGLGFTPRMKNNKMWIRMVDPESHAELAPAYQVRDEDLNDDSALWFTPALPADTKALLQISLNGHDWHNVPNGRESYSFLYYESPHVVKLSPTYGPVKHKGEILLDIEGTYFKCPDAKCSDLTVRFGEPGQAIYQKAQWISATHIQTKVPRYAKPDVLRVEVTVNGKDWTNDGRTYGYFDPYVLRAEPALVSVEGTTKVRIKGFGFVNSTSSKSLFASSNPSTVLHCQGKTCIRDATYIDKNTLETSTFPQALVNYKDNEQNVLWDPINIEASVYGSGESDFTDNGVQIFYYEEPDYKELSSDETPANVESQVYLVADFKKNPIERLKRYSSISCRFKNEEGIVKYTEGSLARYPLDSNGQSNAVICKTPLWDLHGKQIEQVKLDVALNGQDYKGSLDFQFSQELKIHRIVPMAGPSSGGLRTKIIGSGFKPNKESVELKWGIETLTVIPKSQVEDYIYQRVQFENMIEGSEELKAYIYEAAIFPRVDSTLEEDLRYHQVTMRSAALSYWTQTHGGPYYVEVGKHIDVPYKVLQNVSVTVTSNNVTSVQSVEKEIVKVWTIYDFEPSAVEYYHYKDCIIKDIQPHSGLILGGTEVAVSGAWFSYMPEYGVVPHCKFGDKIVRAQFDSTVRITCQAPPGDELGVLIPFEVSLNGIDFTSSGMQFSYYDVPTIYNVIPSMGPESGGTLIYLNGSKFTNISNPQEFNCKFTPIGLPIPPKKVAGIFMNSTTIMCPSPGGWGQGVAVKLQVTFNGGDYDQNNFIFTFFSITRAFPRSGPSDGNGGDIIVEGFGFRNDTTPLCRINNTVYEPISVSWKQIRCPMPKAKGGDQFFGNVDLAVSANGVDWHEFIGGFQYYPQPVVEDIYPKQGPSLGVGIINFYGSGFRNDYNLVDMACKVGEAVGKAVYVSPQHIKCVVEDMELVNEGEYLPAQVALNRYSWSSLGNSTFFLPYGIEQIYPNSGPITGVTDVIIQGKGFIDEEGSLTPRCRFGTPANFAIVDAQILSFERLTCKAPADYKPSIPGTFPEDVPFSVALTADENDPWTETSHKFRFYEQPILASCDPCESDVGAIRELYVSAQEGSIFFEPIPTVQKGQSDEEDDQRGLLQLASTLGGGITCQFGHFGETQAVYVNETTIKCVTPIFEDDPDSIYRETVKLTVAMNGVDHEDASSELEFTFIGTGTYLVFWPFLIGVLLVCLLIVAVIFCVATIFQKRSWEDMLEGFSRNQPQGGPHVMNLNGVHVPRTRSDWNDPRSSVRNIERVTGQNF